jgi:hypothetical protein
LFPGIWHRFDIIVAKRIADHFIAFPDTWNQRPSGPAFRPEKPAQENFS